MFKFLNFNPESLPEHEIQEINEVLEDCKNQRALHREFRNGYTNDRGKTMRRIIQFPLYFLFHQELKKFFDIEHTQTERKKDQRHLAQAMKDQFGWNFYTVDNP